MKRCREHLRRRTLLLGFSQDPAQFINGIVATQVCLRPREAVLASIPALWDNVDKHPA